MDENTSGMVPVFVNAVPDQAEVISDIDQFAMHVDQWHAHCMEMGNRVLELGAENVVITVEDETNPGQAIQITLDAITARIFRIGAMAALNVFKDLPFGASLDNDTADE